MTIDLRDAVRCAAAELIDNTVDRLRAAIRLPSINPAVGGAGEGAVQQFVAQELDRLGCRVEVWEPDADALADRFPDLRPGLRPEGFRGRPNVVGWLPAEVPRATARVHLILNSHTDTVSPGDAAGWTRVPHSAALEDGTIYGLGAADAKGCLFTFLGAAELLRHIGVRLRRNVMIQSVVDEEWGGAGTLECIRRGYTATAALVGEPTELRVCPASRGAMNLRLRVTGRRAHPGEGWRGVNAIRKAWLYIEALDRLRDELDRTRMHPLWADLPAGHVWNLTAISGGASGTIGGSGRRGQVARTVPDICEVSYGIGLIGAERPATLQPQVEAALDAVTAADPWLSTHPPDVGWQPGAFEPAVTDPAHPAVVSLAQAVEDAGRGPAAVRAFSAASDARHLTNAAGIPSVNFGPGALHLAHSPRECLQVNDLRSGIEAVAIFLARYCGITGAFC